MTAERVEMAVKGGGSGRRPALPAADVVVAIDGPAGAGKSTVARAVAARAGLRYLDTGTTYRAVTLALLRRGVAVDEPAAVAKAAAEVEVALWPDPDDSRTLGVRVGGAEPGGALRSAAVNAAVSAVSAVPAVRERLVAIQRRAMAGGGIVAEGRDVGTVVWPGAEVKVFLTADPQERARRRSVDEGDDAGAAIAARDQADAGGRAAPRAHPDATVIDSTGRPVEDVIEEVVALVEAARRVRRR